MTRFRRFRRPVSTGRHILTRNPPCRRSQKGFPMRLIVVYCILVAIGEVIAFFLGLIVEQVIPSFSMLIYMLMFFGVLWGGWPISVYITERWLMPDDEVRASGVARP
jgi:hypothetical protein